MTFYHRSYDHGLSKLADTLEAEGPVQIWTFDDQATRRTAEARFAARGIEARCHSAYKPLLCAFRDGLATPDLVAVDVAYPCHEVGKANRFLLETYPLQGLYPQITFHFTPKAVQDGLPQYDLRLHLADGRTQDLTILAPNRRHIDYSGNEVLSPCGWIEIAGQGQPLWTDYEALFHHTMTAIEREDWGQEPYFQEMNIAVTLPQADEPLGYGDEVLSLREALHEDLYFSLLEVFQRKSGRAVGDRNLRPGQIVPEVRQGDQIEVRVELRPYDAQSFATFTQDLETADRALSQGQILSELNRIQGDRFEAQSVAGRPLWAVHHAGSDRGVIISTGQHANETSSPVGALRAVRRLLAREEAHFILSPLENPDGYALHQRLIADNARHMHHAARYTALGDDLEYRTGDQLWEKSIRRQAEARLPAVLHLNLHGYPAHEWTRPLSGYVPRTFEMWTIPKGFFLILRHLPGWAGPARVLMDQVTRQLNEVNGLRAFNEGQIAAFEGHAGETGFEILNGFPVMISEDLRHTLPMTLITEYPDETVYGDAFRAAHEAQMATILAAYDALQGLDLPVS